MRRRDHATTGPPGPAVLLPVGPPPLMTLVEALAHRSAPPAGHARVTAAGLATLLWYAHATIRTDTRVGRDGGVHHETVRPHPGDAARLRLLAYDVEGLASGRYQVDGGSRVLWHLGHLAGRAVATEALGGDGPGPPALLALYTERRSRQDGRHALVEAGHLAQNLTLVAAATGLTLTAVTRFPAWTGRRLLGLESGQVPVYLLPLGRVSVRSAPR